MDLSLLPTLLGWAVVVPLVSFTVIVLAGPRLGKNGEGAGYCASAAIALSCVLSLVSLFGCWLPNHWPTAEQHGSHAAAGTEVGGPTEPAPAPAAHEGAGVDGADQTWRGQEVALGEDAAFDGPDSARDPDAQIPASRTAHVALAEPSSAHEPALSHELALAPGGQHADPEQHVVEPVTGDYYVLGEFGKLRMSIGYYIDSLTVCMFCMVSLIATCIHVYAMGYMHDELHDFTDPEVTLSDGSKLNRPGRYHRFFQFLSLFCFSMLGLVLAGNIAMTFVFWELVGICSYFLIGFYIERQSASTAANKAFIVNRVGDFGMIIGLMAIWGALGTFNFGSIDGQPGIFELVRPAAQDHQLVTPLGMVRAVLPGKVQEVVRSLPPGSSEEQMEAAVDAAARGWRDVATGPSPGYWLLIIAGVGIFCGCAGKSAQFPLHVWLPDAMEGPTPVSALVHSATMVAAGVFLVARFYPVFAPEALLVIAIAGTITLFMAATIAITATDIKKVLAYSTISQLGYMMLALGVGGWLAGVMHLFTHAFFKSLLFLCSGSVIHAVHTNELPLMGGLRKKMPWTAYTMLIGCLAIAGAGVPFLIGFSGYYSKDSILEQALSFNVQNPTWGPLFFYAAAGGAAITAFYMFRLWYLTFAGQPRDQHRFEHAHESPPTMHMPLILLSIFAVAVAWRPFGNPDLGLLGNEGIVGGTLAVVIFAILRQLYVSKSDAAAGHAAHGQPAHGLESPDPHGGRAATTMAAVGHDHGPHEQAEEGHGTHADVTPEHAINVGLAISGVVLAIAMLWTVIPGLGDVTLSSLLEQARPAGTLPTQAAVLSSMTWPSEHDSHAAAIKVPATLIAFSTALAGIILATVFYGWRYLNAADVRDQFSPIYKFLLNKWWFDELYDLVFVRPTRVIAEVISSVDRNCIDWLIDNLARGTQVFAEIWDRIADRTIVDGFVNRFAAATYHTGLSLRKVQSGRLRQYVMLIAAGTVAAFVVASFLWSVNLTR
jgi:NADH-quinone oxidoreductase subunit L